MGMVPQSHAIPVLITRPEPQASRFCAALQNRYGALVQPILTPLLRPAFKNPVLPKGPFGSVVFTSETAVRAAVALTDAVVPKRAYCVGDHTAQVATELGFQAHSAAGDAENLLKLLSDRPEHSPFLHLRGREARGDLADRLAAAGVPAVSAVVYAQETLPLSAQAIKALQGDEPVIVPLFSPRSAEQFYRGLQNLPQVADLLPRLKIAALSPAVAAVLSGCPAQNIAIALAPNQAELFLVLDRFIFIA